VDVPEDLLTAKIGISVIGSDGDARTTVRALNHASGKIQEVMMRKIRLRHTPQLRFEVDDKFRKTLETFELIEKAMREIREKQPDEDHGDDSDMDQT
jgi:ribosome-binding factor A